MGIDVAVIFIYDSSRQATMRSDNFVVLIQGLSRHATKPPLQLAQASPRNESRNRPEQTALMSLEV